MKAINLKSTITYVNTQFDNLIIRCLNYDTRNESNIQLLTNILLMLLFMILLLNKIMIK